LSADNGIYILKTKDQYRVIYAQAIENLYWNPLDESSFDKLIPTRIVEYYGKSKYTHNKDIVRDIAFNMARKTPVLEYGVREIIIDKTWKQIVKEAKEQALLEMEHIEYVKKNSGGNWNYEVSKLEEIINM
jgi:hypothetical protein